MGHGHVIPNKDGTRARCGGPAVCSECALELSSAIKNKTHAESPDCWCSPVLIYKGEDGEADVWSHNDVVPS